MENTVTSETVSSERPETWDPIPSVRVNPNSHASLISPPFGRESPDFSTAVTRMEISELYSWSVLSLIQRQFQTEKTVTVASEAVPTVVPTTVTVGF